MSGTKEGNLKGRDKNLAKNPNHYSDLSKKRKSVGGGFRNNSELARRAGALGGRKLRNKDHA
jgi:general stress protein YciG